jgi:hypothetical protein
VPVASRSDLVVDLVINVLDGPVSGREWLDVMSCQVTSDEFLRASRALTDLTSATDLEQFTDHDLDQGVAFLAAHPRPVPTRRKAAMVAHGGFDVAKVFEHKIGASRWGAIPIVFNDVTTACAWLGVDVQRVRSAIASMRAELRTPLL